MMVSEITTNFYALAGSILAVISILVILLSSEIARLVTRSPEYRARYEARPTGHGSMWRVVALRTWWRDYEWTVEYGDHAEVMDILAEMRQRGA